MITSDQASYGTSGVFDRKKFYSHMRRPVAVKWPRYTSCVFVMNDEIVQTSSRHFSPLTRNIGLPVVDKNLGLCTTAIAKWRRHHRLCKSL